MVQKNYICMCYVLYSACINVYIYVCMHMYIIYTKNTHIIYVRGGGRRNDLPKVVKFQQMKTHLKILWRSSYYSWNTSAQQKLNFLFFFLIKEDYNIIPGLHSLTYNEKGIQAGEDKDRGQSSLDIYCFIESILKTGKFLLNYKEKLNSKKAISENQKKKILNMNPVGTTPQGMSFSMWFWKSNLT